MPEDNGSRVPGILWLQFERTSISLEHKLKYIQDTLDVEEGPELGAEPEVVVLLDVSPIRDVLGIPVNCELHSCNKRKVVKPERDKPASLLRQTHYNKT